ncbi:hypothetical protein [Paenibacillus senegalensis]|uniref:hypothetical protein n=1 Tax=Paenibacillus senegalensis TaxID=1465766 RepID=UPI0002880631|nr:hypothetical protein [Paenibacillus senegalensis]
MRKKGLRKYIFITFILSLSLLGFYIYSMESNQNGTRPDDIMVKATLQHNNNPRMNHKDIMLEVIIDKKRIANI